MKQLKCIIATTLLFCSSIVMGQGVDKEELTVPLSTPGKPYKLKVSLFAGSIKVTGYTGDKIIINVESEDEERKSKKAEKQEGGLKKISGTPSYEIKVVEENNDVSVSNRRMLGAINLEIKVPQSGTLVLNTVNGGEISVTGLKGELELNNVNGDIKLLDISGSAIANTVNGDIKASFSSVTSDKPMAFSTFNGDVNLSFPPTMKANLKMKTDQGEVFSDFEVAIDKTAAAPVKSNSGGTYKIIKDAWVTGKINGGGAEVMVKSWGGDLYIRKNK